MDLSTALSVGSTLVIIPKIELKSKTKPKKHIFTYANVYLICKTR